MIRTLTNLKKQEKNNWHVPDSVQKVIPIQRIWTDGIFLVGKNKYSLTYKLSDINYAVASKEDKEAMFLEYSELLNFFDSGAVTVGGATLHCWKHGGHGEQTYLEVVENSCNPGFVNLGLKLGKEKLFNYIDLFGFGEKTGVDLNGEAEGIIFNVDKIGDLELELNYHKNDAN